MTLTVGEKDISTEDQNIQNFAKHMLKGRLFVGIYQENRYVEKLKCYRDIISINSTETKLKNDLNIVFKRISAHYKSPWIGITTPDMIGAPAGHSLWVTLENQVFGCYWFKIKGLKFKNNEISLRIEKIRPVSETELKSEEEIIANTTGEADISLQLIKEKLRENIKDFLLNIYTLITLHNIKETIIFISILIVTLFTGILHTSQYFLDFALKLFRELSIFTNSATPIVIAGIHMIEKIFGGFYMLIAILWKDRHSPNQKHIQQNQRYLPIQYQQNNRIGGYKRAMITEIE